MKSIASKGNGLWIIVCFLLIVGFFLHFAAGGLGAFFSGDDVMNLENLHGCLTVPYWRVVEAAIVPFSVKYRPVGGMFYNAMFAGFGFNPVPFRYACFGLMIVNLALAYLLLRRLAGSAEAALFGLLAIAYHGTLSELYFSTGTVYDLLCYGLMVGALLLYVRHRQDYGAWTLRTLVWMLVLNLLALHAKEMACTLPVLLLLYELTYGKLRPRLDRATLRQLFPVLITGAFTGALMLYRMYGPHGFDENAAYRPTLSFAFFLKSAARYHNMLFYCGDWFTARAVVWFWLLLAGLAWLTRRKELAFGLGFWILALVPVSLIPGRSGFVLYFPLIGLGLCAGVLVSMLREKISERMQTFPAAVSAARVILTVLLVLGLGRAHTVMHTRSEQANRDVDGDNRRFAELIAPYCPQLPRKARILFLQDPFNNGYFMTHTLRLMKRDPDLWIDRVKLQGMPQNLSKYAKVFRYDGTHLTDCTLMK